MSDVRAVVAMLILLVLIAGILFLLGDQIRGKIQQMILEARAAKAEAEAEKAEAEARAEAARVARINAEANAFSTKTQAATGFLYDVMIPPVIGFLVVALMASMGLGGYAWGVVVTERRFRERG
jgi:predicted PurR-regulated permease PerM